MAYDILYGENRDYFGAQPESILEDHCGLLDRSVPVLDIGAGQGRNSLYLARQGYRVIALDPSPVAIDTIADEAAKEQLPIEPHACGFETFAPGEERFGGALLFGLIQILDWDGIKNLIDRTGRWTQAGGHVFITAFSTEDPRYETHADAGKKIGNNSFVISGSDSAEGEIRTYLERNEILGLFAGWEIAHHWEGLGADHRHGDGPPERHGRIEAVLRKQG
jgi:SAM-dependent methyltransferase